MRALIFFALLALAACSGTGAPVETAAATTAPSIASTEAESATEPAQTAGPAAQTPTQTAEASSSTAAPQETATAVLYEGLTQGFTNGGYPFLGDPQAPVILTDYSDFL